MNFNVKYGYVLDKWLYDRKDNIKITSYVKYLDIIESLIKPVLGDIKFRKLSESDIICFFDNDFVRRYSNSTRKIAFIIIKSSILFGKSIGFRNNIKNFNVKINKPNIRCDYLTKVEQNILCEYLNKKLNVNNLALLLTINTGLRIGELSGLKRSDFDFLNGTLTINRTVSRINNVYDNNSKTMLIIGLPKSITSSRIIPIPSNLLPHLYNYFYDMNSDYYVFNNSIKPKDPRCYDRTLKYALNKCNIRNVNFHTLRHTFATRAIESGMNIKVLSEILGHSSYHITQELYVHISNEFKKNSIDCLMNYLFQKK